MPGRRSFHKLNIGELPLTPSAKTHSAATNRSPKSGMSGRENRAKPTSAHLEWLTIHRSSARMDSFLRRIPQLSQLFNPGSPDPWKKRRIP
jgi:hypothetical protein